RPPRAGPLAGRPGASLDGPGGSESLLAAAVRRRPGEDGRGLRQPGRASLAPRVARLAGGTVHRGRLGRQEDGQADGDVGHLSAVIEVDAGEAGEGPGESAAVAWPASPPGGRDTARPGPVREWSDGREAGRTRGQAAAAGGVVGGGRL